MIIQTFRDRLIDAYMAAIPLITLNLLLFILSLPLITLIPAIGALFYAPRPMDHGKTSVWRT